MEQRDKNSCEVLERSNALKISFLNGPSITLNAFDYFGFISYPIC